MKNKSVLVTGGAGFIGSHLVDNLVYRGAKVTVVDNLSSGRMTNLKKSLSEINFFELDVLSEQIYPILNKNKFDYIFHLAANSYVPPSVKEPEFDFNNTLLTTLRLLEYIRKKKYPTVFIVLSSAAIYGSPEKMPIHEDCPPNPISPYGVSKLAVENYVKVFARLYSIKCASLRLFSAYGPRQYKQIVYDFMLKLKENKNELEIIGNGKQMRDIIYVKDVIQALTLIANKSTLNGECYNVANGAGYSTIDLARWISRFFHINPTFKFTGNIREGDADKWIANIDRINNLGYSPKYSLLRGLKETFEWFQRSYSYNGRK